MRRLCLAAAVVAAVVHSAAAQPAPPPADAVLVLDASGSMWGLVDGRSKIATARAAVGSVLQKWPAGDRLGLMVYGHRSKTDCRDIEMVVPISPVDPARIRAAVEAVVPKGKTPLSDSLRAAAAALKPGGSRANVILVSDGIETCGADPCAVAAELKRAQVGLTAHVIGFDVADPVAKAQLQCIAQATGGVYLDARNAGALEGALGRAVEASHGVRIVSEAPPRPVARDPLEGRNLRAVARLAEGLDPITDAVLAWALHRPGAVPDAGNWLRTEYGARLAIAVDPAAYVLRVEYGQVKRDFPVEVVAGKVAAHDFVLDAGYVTSEGAIQGSGQKAEQVAWEISSGGTWIATAYDPVPRFVLPAGRYDLKITKGSASATKSFDLAAGDSINVALTLDAARLVAEAVYARGGPKVTQGLAVEVRRPSSPDGSEGEWIATQYDAQSAFDLPSGSYDVVVKLGLATVRQTVEVRSGAPTRISVDLDAGVVGLASPGAEAVEIFEARRDIAGQRRWIGTVYGDRHDITLNAGDYAVVVTRGGNKTEVPVTVKAGARVEIAVGR